jgi:hypothetical protein
MSRHFFHRSIAIALAGCSLITATSALAAPFKDSDGNIHIQDLTASQKIDIQYGTLSTKRVANGCGLVSISKPSSIPSMPSSIMVGTDTIDVASLPVQTTPKCTNNVLAETRSTNFKTSSGTVVVVGKTSGVSYDVTFTGVPTTKTSTANACGFVRISNSATKPAPTSFTYGGQNYDTAALPTQIPSRCYNGIKFVPQ